MTEPDSPRWLPGPKTVLRAGATLGSFSVSVGKCTADTVHDRGAAARRALVDEIRTQAAGPARKKRRRY